MLNDKKTIKAKNNMEQDYSKKMGLTSSIQVVDHSSNTFKKFWEVVKAAKRKRQEDMQLRDSDD